MRSKLFVILPMLMLLIMAGCDSDNNGMAQDMTDPNACPCFSAQDIKDDAMGKDFFGCSVQPSALATAIDLSEGQTEFTINTACQDAEFGFCECVDGVRNVVNQSMNKEQFFDCTQILVDAITNEFGQESMSMCLIAN